MAVILFRTAAVDVDKRGIRATFSDGTKNSFHLSAMSSVPEYRNVAEWAGYGDDWQRFGREHEIAHHWLADRLGWPWSWSLHDNPPQPWPAHVAWEEHICTRLQRLSRTGERDEFKVLPMVFGSDLAAAVADLESAWRRVL
jgi:hypothetical protein